MTPEEIRNGMSQVIAQHGEWTAHNLHLGHNIYTVGGNRPYLKLQRILQSVVDLSARPLSELRILDLACLEGGFAIEFARHGATVLGIEGREANLAKAEFAKRALNLKNVQFELGDVRDLSPARHGEFDVVLCAGILYHLDAPDLFQFVESIAAVCRRLAFVDTSIALNPRQSHTFHGRQYWGGMFPEHDDSSSANDRMASLWASLDNVRSFWLTRPSLLNLLKDVGFTSAFEVLNPNLPGQLLDRTMLAAIKGSRAVVHAAPATNETPFADWPERPSKVIDPMQRRTYELEKRLTHMIPQPLRRAVKSMLGRSGESKAAPPWTWDAPWKSRSSGSQADSSRDGAG